MLSPQAERLGSFIELATPGIYAETFQPCFVIVGLGAGVHRGMALAASGASNIKSRFVDEADRRAIDAEVHHNALCVCLVHAWPLVENEADRIACSTARIWQW